MHKSEITAVFLAAILFAGALTAGLPSFIGDAEASSDERDKKDRDHKSYDKYDKYSYDKKSYGYDDYKDPKDKKSYGYDDYKDPKEKKYYDEYSSYEPDYYKKPSYGDNGYDNNHDKFDKFKKFNLDFYVVVGETYTETFQGAADLESTATCDEGDQVTGGGFELITEPEGTTQPQSESKIVSTIPFEDDGEGWFAFAQSTQGPGETSLTAYAVCFDDKPKHTTNNAMTGMSAFGVPVL